MSIMKKIKIISAFIAVLAISLVFYACYPDEGLDVEVRDDETVLMTELDRYIQENFTDQYGMAIRYRFEDRFVSPGERATPPRLEVVRPMLDFIEEFWIDPYLDVENGRDFFENHVPAEIVFLGGFIFNDDGTVTLGTADAGAQITFTNVNAIDPDSAEWRDLQLQTVYHEFAHTVHQRYTLPTAFETFTPSGYTSAGSWFNLTEEEALQRGFVSPYATSSPNEDFAETVAFFLFDSDFDENFMEDEQDCTTADCEARNAGRESIRQKMASISDHYFRVTNVDLMELREAVQSRL